MHALHTPRLVLEPLRREHAAAMFPLLQDPSIYTHLDHGPPPTLAHLEGVYTRLEARRSPDGREQWLNWILFPRESAEQGKEHATAAHQAAEPAAPLGVVQATVLAGGRAWVAYELPAAHRGRGHAREAVQAMMAELAASFGVQQFMATVEADNERSIHLLRKLGFREASAQGITTLTPTERLYLR